MSYILNAVKIFLALLSLTFWVCVTLLALGVLAFLVAIALGKQQ